MSYCRWSSDDFRCDVYVYADANGGWTTHTRGSSINYLVPVEPEIPLTQSTGEAFLKRMKRMTALRDDPTKCEWKAIDHPDADKTFNHETPGECAAFLTRLKQEGFCVPQEAINDLLEEEAERTAKT